MQDIIDLRRRRQKRPRRLLFADNDAGTSDGHQDSPGELQGETQDETQSLDSDGSDMIFFER